MDPRTGCRDDAAAVRSHSAQEQELRRVPSRPFVGVRRSPWQRFGVRLSAVLAVLAGGALGDLPDSASTGSYPSMPVRSPGAPVW